MQDIDSPLILDVRPHNHYLSGHLPGAVHFNLLDGPDLWHELPPKNIPLHLCVLKEQAETAIQLLNQHRYEVVKVTTHEELAKLELNTGVGSNRSWRGNPLLEHHADLLKCTVDSDLEKPLVLDIGCGSGRDSILLAQLGFRVIAIDNQAKALERLKISAQNWNVAVTPKLMDCKNQMDDTIELIIQQQPALIMQSRFLHRPLLDVYKMYLPVNSKVAIHTFLEGAADFGSPKNPDFLLKNNELAERFADWSVLLDQVHTLDDGRPLSLFVAQKVTP